MKTPFFLVVYKTFHAQRNQIRPGMAAIGLSPGQPKILNYLLEHDHCMQRQVAEGCDIEPATVSRILTNMEQQGLIERGDPGRRAAEISLTDKGREAQRQWRGICHEVEERAQEGFGTEERERFRGDLCRMYHNLTGKVID